MLQSKPARRLLTLSGFVVLLSTACLGAGQVALHNSQASLTRFEFARSISAPCVGKNSSLYNMPTVGVTTEWRIAATPIQVMNRFMQNGWGPITRMSSNMRLVPNQPTAAQIGVLQVRVITVASIRYADDKLSTRLFLPVSFVFCLREL
jgi:hypothetical protein